ncbi:MAG: alkaline phosphatase family protein [Armatimonadota bacterium]
MDFAYIDPGSGYVIASGFLAYILAACAAFFGIILLRLKKIIAFCKARPKAAVVLGIAVPVAVLGFIAYRLTQGNTMPPSDFKGRIVILGIDGMSPVVLEPLMREGKLPHFAALAKEGAYHRLQTTNPSQSPVAWAGFATGQNPGKHGLYDFIRRDPKLIGDEEKPALSLSTSNFDGGKMTPVITAERFWNYATGSGVPSVILNCPVTFPPDKINGRMLSGMGVPDILGTEGTFTYYTSEAVAGADEGGKVVQVAVSEQIDEFLYGPMRTTPSGPENTRVPMHISVDVKAHTATIEIKGGDRFTLKQGEWTDDWHAVTFSLGLFKKIKGIVQFYLVQADDQAFKLYASPINYDPRDPFFAISSPEGYAKELVDEIGCLYHTQGMASDTWSLNEERLTEEQFLRRVTTITENRRKMMDLELKRSKRGIVYSYYDCLDVIQHMFWRYRDPKNPLYEPKSKYAGTINEWYVKMDELLGHVMGQLEKDDVLIVLSDHGFASFRRAANVNTWLRKNGYLALKEGKSEGGELLADIDWSKTRAYALGFGSLYLNLQGREAHGIVQPGEAEALKKELVEKLSAWKDTGGEKVMSRVYTREEIFWGDRKEESPDLCLGFADGYRASWQTALGAVPATLVEDNAKKWSGDHLIDPALVPGILFSNQEITRENPSMYDLTPTILSILGYKPDDLEKLKLDGKPLL